MNCLDTPVSTQAQGKWFSFKPREIKLFYQPEVARFMGQMRGDEGLVEIPDQIMELEKDDASRIQFLEERRKEGITKRVSKLEWQKYNLLASLKLDLEVKGMKVDPVVIASKGDLAALKELNALHGEIKKQEINMAEAIRKELGLDVNHTGSTESGKNDSGHPHSTQPAKAGK